MQQPVAFLSFPFSRVGCSRLRVTDADRRKSTCGLTCSCCTFFQLSTTVEELVLFSFISCAGVVFLMSSTRSLVPVAPQSKWLTAAPKLSFSDALRLLCGLVRPTPDGSLNSPEATALYDEIMASICRTPAAEAHRGLLTDDDILVLLSYTMEGACHLHPFVNVWLSADRSDPFVAENIGPYARYLYEAAAKCAADPSLLDDCVAATKSAAQIAPLVSRVKPPAVTFWSLCNEFTQDRSGKREIKPEKEGSGALHCAASNGQLDVVKILVERGANLRAFDECGATPLHISAEKGQIEVVKYLLSKGASNRAFDRDGTTALHRAVRGGNSDVIRLLLDKGAVKVVDRHGVTLLHVAANRNRTDLLKFLVDKGGDANARDEDGRELIHHAAVGGAIDVVNVLLDKGVYVDEPDSDKTTPLMLAAHHGHADLVSLLLKRGANKKLMNDNGWCALDVAKRSVRHLLV